MAERTGSQSEAVINGISSDATQDAVVMFVHADLKTYDFGGCTGTMLSPRIVLTARHCVSKTDQGALCDREGNPVSAGRVYSNMAPETMYAIKGSSPDLAAIYRGKQKPDGQGAKLFVPDSSTMCNSDIALVVLKEPVKDALIAPLRLDHSPALGEKVTVVGWGVTQSGQNANTRQQRTDVEILEVGPTLNRGSEVGPKEFIVGESICSGDSGGPALSSTGAVLGVVSRGGNGESNQNNPADSCTGPNARNTYTQVAGYKDLILEVFAYTGESPWYEGGVKPGSRNKDEECTNNADCGSQFCVENKCTEKCVDDTSCGSGTVCDTGSGICVAAPPAEDSTALNADGSQTVHGCSTTETSSPASTVTWLSGLALVGLLSRKRRSR